VLVQTMSVSARPYLSVIDPRPPTSRAFRIIEGPAPCRARPGGSWCHSATHAVTADAHRTAELPLDVEAAHLPKAHCSSTQTPRLSGRKPSLGELVFSARHRRGSLLAKTRGRASSSARSAQDLRANPRCIQSRPADLREGCVRGMRPGPVSCSSPSSSPRGRSHLRGDGLSAFPASTSGVSRLDTVATAS
jgi:hypothetical protein